MHRSFIFGLLKSLVILQLVLFWNHGSISVLYICIFCLKWVLENIISVNTMVLIASFCSIAVSFTANLERRWNLSNCLSQLCSNMASILCRLSSFKQRCQEIMRISGPHKSQWVLLQLQACCQSKKLSVILTCMLNQIALQNLEEINTLLVEILFNINRL